MNPRFTLTAPVAGALLLAFLLALGATPLAAQSRDPLTKNSKDPRKIATQIKSALPLVEQGYSMLNASMAPEPTQGAVELLLRSYRYLRAAYQSNNLILSTSRVPDPLLELENKQINYVRDRLLDCTGNRQYLTDTNRIRDECIEGLAAGLRTLRMLAVTLP
ncbi:MAG: hypothetical protein ACREKQ_12725 [Candidatus Rokuibacteriota bacterium]